MEIFASDGDWTPNDEENLAKFLDTPTGKRVVPELVRRAPALLEGGEINAILIRSGKVLAFTEMVEQLITMAHPPTASFSHSTITNYPSPEDDSAWNDGQLLTPENRTSSETSA